jgi:hypothetical protein
MSSLVLSTEKFEDLRLFIDLAQRLGVQYTLPTKIGNDLTKKKKRKYGFAKDFVTYIAPDFDETPAGFEDYKPEIFLKCSI